MFCFIYFQFWGYQEEIIVLCSLWFFVIFECFEFGYYCLFYQMERYGIRDFKIGLKKDDEI